MAESARDIAIGLASKKRPSEALTSLAGRMDTSLRAAQLAHRWMLDTATRMMQAGETPSVTGVAEAAGVSRATAYRCFPSQTALIGAVVDQGLGTILPWDSESDDAEERVAGLSGGIHKIVTGDCRRARIKPGNPAILRRG